MSDSDSDLDYESADDEPSFHTNVINNNTTEETQIPDSAIIKNSTDEEKSTSAVYSASCDVGLEVDNKLVPKSKFENPIMPNSITIQPPDENTNQYFADNKPIKTDECDIKDISNKMNTVESFDKESDIAVEKENNIAEVKKENVITEVKKVNDIDAKKVTKEKTDERVHDKQRVTLRLEKKLQQQSQTLKNSLDRESSDISTIEKEQTQSKNSWGFSSWGSNLFSTAASSVTTFTSQVSQGIGTVIDTVENTLGVPPAEELAVSLADRKEPTNTNENDISEKTTEAKVENSQESKISILPGISSWTKVIENTGSKVIMGGLDTLELIGKKTIDIITEGDPGLRKKRAAFDGMNLSQILREAKEKAKLEEDQNEQDTDTVNYSQVFDEYQGLIHLEALEMLSKQSQAKLGRLLIRVPRNAEARKNMEEIKSICEDIPALDDPPDCENFEDFQTIFTKHTLELNLPFDGDSIIKAHKRITDVVRNYELSTSVTNTPEEIFHSAIYSLAEFSARSMETFHKLAELILVQSSRGFDYEKLATNLTGLTTVMCIEVNNLSARYQHCLDRISEQPENAIKKSDMTPIITNLYVEAANSNKYIQDAFLLLVPVLQSCLLEFSN